MRATTITGAILATVLAGAAVHAGTGATVAAGAALIPGTGGESAGLARMDLGGAWEVYRDGAGPVIPATVPGCVHTDLLAAKLIPDPFFRDNEAAVQWVSDHAWTYRRSFEAGPDLLARQHVLLRCEGLDTLAAVRLNGAEVGRTDNMFRTWEFDVKGRLKPGRNTIEVAFDPVVPYVRAKEAARKLPTWAYPGAAYVRKEPCNFGWDWGPTLITCGIWRPIALLAFDGARLDDVLVLQDHSRGGTVGLEIRAAAGPAAGPDWTVAASVALEGRSVGTGDAKLRDGRVTVAVDVADPKLWWPAGMGAQPLYAVTVDLKDGRGQRVDTWKRRVGLRTLRAFQQTKDAPMRLEVNGIPFFAKGANVIPADPFAPRVTAAALRRIVDDAVSTNMNALRFWGGGYYEDDALFDACDERGVCVWMDFKFACSTYPAFDDAFLKSVEMEARDQVRRLRHHAAIAVWCGNNEIMAFRGKAWTATTMSEADYNRLFRDTLGGVVATLAPQADYVTGSPDCGDVHFWDVWHGGKPFEAYRGIHGFVSEFGFQAFPDPATIAAFTDAADRTTVESPAIKYHMRSDRMYMTMPEDGTKGTNKLLGMMRRYFREPKDFESAVRLSQVTQGYGIQYGAEGWRREMPKSMGCVYWQLNDTWPGTSWSSVDYFGRWKALQYMARRFYAPVLVTGEADAATGAVSVYVASDRMDAARGRLTWMVTDLDGRRLDGGARDIDVPARAAGKVETLPLGNVVRAKGAANVLVWLGLRVDGREASDNLTTFAYPREMELGDPGLKVTVAGDGAEFRVAVTAARPALWTWLELEGADARFSDNYFHVAPETETTVTVRPSSPMPRAAFEKALKVRSLYDTYK